MVLSTDQSTALDMMTDFIFRNNTETAFSLIGKPGTGKTFLIKELIKDIKRRGYRSYVLCAPTHKAASVLRAGTKETVKTIHQLLSLSPKIDILEFDLRNLFFTKSDSSKNLERLIICDEASMINDDLYDHLLERCNATGAKIIFIGDIKQLQPVKSDTLSKVFTLSNRFELTQNHRQDDEDLINLIEDSRKALITDFNPYASEHCELFTSAKKILNTAVDNFKVQSMLEFTQFCKVLTYTNNRVERFNRYIHENITDEEYCFNELLTGYANSDFIHNSEDYIVKDVRLKQKTLPFIKKSILGYELNIKSLNSGLTSDVFILPRETDEVFLSFLAEAIENIRISAINGKKPWSHYYMLDKSFITPHDLVYGDRVVKQKGLDYGYAMTIHKSQSSTYDVVYYDNNSLQFCYNKDEKRQLQYVALSRVKQQLNILI